MRKSIKKYLPNREILPYLKDLQMDDCQEYVEAVQALTNFLLELESDGKITKDDILFIVHLTSQMRINTVSHLKNKIGEAILTAVNNSIYDTSVN